MTGFNRVFSRVPGLVVLFALMTAVTGRPALAQDIFGSVGMTGFNRVFSRVPGLVVLVALMAAVTGLPALAEDNHIQRYGEKDKEETPTEKAAKKEAETGLSAVARQHPRAEDHGSLGNCARGDAEGRGQDRVAIAEAEGQERNGDRHQDRRRRQAIT